MKLPGDDGVQGIPIDSLTVDPDLTEAEAVELAQELGDESAHVEPDGYKSVDPEFVVRAIDFKQYDRFVVDGEYDDANGRYVVASNPTWSSTILVAPVWAEPGDEEYEHAGDWNQMARYFHLWVAWLRGNVRQVRVETQYVDAETGEVLEL